MTRLLDAQDVLNAMEEATIALFAANHGHGGCELIRAPGQVSTWAPCPSPALNAILQTRAPASDFEQLIHHAKQRSKGRAFLWKVMPNDHHREVLISRLLSDGFIELEPSTPIWGVIPPELDELRVHLPAATPVRSAEDFAQWLIPFRAAFDLCAEDAALCQSAAVTSDLSAEAPIQHVLIEVDGRPVASGTLVLTHPTLAAVFNVAVLPEARREGHGTSILAALAATAMDQHRTHLGQLSTAAGLPLYANWGQRSRQTCRNFLYLQEAA